ncbi:hypothetical protein MMC06_001537 [Schaereria dolodes]|nr:hypothetical protein [Schaereria dolodes]
MSFTTQDPDVGADLSVDPELDFSFATQMGFSSFGSQKPPSSNKKRRYKHSTDAAMSSTNLTPISDSKTTSTVSLDLPVKPPQSDAQYLARGRRGSSARGWSGRGDFRGKGERVGSGSNHAVLGLERRRTDVGFGLREFENGRAGLFSREGRGGWGGVGGGQGQAKNEGIVKRGGSGRHIVEGRLDPREERDHDEEDEDEDGMPSYTDGTPPPLDTLPPVERQFQRKNSGREATHSVMEDVAAESRGMADGNSYGCSVLDIGDDMERNENFQELVSRDEISIQDSATLDAGMQYDWVALKRGIRNAKGDTAYYDRSFVEDPWRDLPAGMGVDSDGTVG